MTSYDGVIADGAIRFERRLPYSVAAVWDAITNPERLADWWLPFDAEVTVDLRVGGSLVFTGAEPPPMVCEILTLDAPVLFEHTHPASGHMRWELTAVDGGCVLKLTHVVTDVTEAIDNCYVVGLHTSLSRLEPCLAGSPVPWDWDDFALSQKAYAELGLAPS